MQRDIVQFVPFQEFKNNTYKLAKEVLQEIPSQVTEFFMKKNILPRPAKEEDRQKIAEQLSLRSKVDPGKQLDHHKMMLKQAMIDAATSMGYDTFAV